MYSMILIKQRKALVKPLSEIPADYAINSGTSPGDTLV